MRVPTSRLESVFRVLAVAACVQMAAVAPDAVFAQAVPAAPGSTAPVPGRGRGPQPVDPRVQIRMHHFAETGQDIPYSLFVSSKVKKNEKAPLIVTLHGIGGTHTTMMRPNADLRETFGVKSGVLVLDVARGSIAAASGLRGGDVIVSIGRMTVTSPAMIQRAMATADRQLKLTIVRKKRQQSLTLQW